MRYRKKFGNDGEALAAGMLEAEGYKILDKNFQTKLGELDIIACKNGVLHIIEVKTRSNVKYGYPCESVNKEKQERIRKIADCYLSSRKLKWDEISFDVIEVTVNFIKNCI